MPHKKEVWRKQRPIVYSKGKLELVRLYEPCLQWLWSITGCYTTQHFTNTSYLFSVETHDGKFILTMWADKCFECSVPQCTGLSLGNSRYSTDTLNLTEWPKCRVLYAVYWGPNCWNILGKKNSLRNTHKNVRYSSPRFQQLPCFSKPNAWWNIWGIQPDWPLGTLLDLWHGIRPSQLSAVCTSFSCTLTHYSTLTHTFVYPLHTHTHTHTHTLTGNSIESVPLLWVWRQWPPLWTRT